MTEWPSYGKFLSKKNLYEYLRKRDGLVCRICKQSLLHEWGQYQDWINSDPKTIKRTSINLSIDHRIPASEIRKSKFFVYKKGWKWKDTDNLFLTHMLCNFKKGKKTYLYV